MLDIIPELILEVLSFLPCGDITSLGHTSKTWYSFLSRYGIYEPGVFHRVIGSRDKQVPLHELFIAQSPRLSMDPVMLSCIIRRNTMVQSTVIQCMSICRFEDAAAWLRNRLGLRSLLHGNNRRLSLYRSLAWDHLSYCIVKGAFSYAHAGVHLIIRSLPALIDRGRVIYGSSRIFMLNLLQNEPSKLLLCGTNSTLMYDLWSDDTVTSITQAARDHLKNDSGGVGSLWSEKVFCSVTASIGSCLAAFPGRHLIRLELVHYSFNLQRIKGRDVSGMVYFLRTSTCLHTLILRHVYFVHGDDFEYVVQAAVGCDTLRHLTLKVVRSHHAPTRDPIRTILHCKGKKNLHTLNVDRVDSWEHLDFVLGLPFEEDTVLSHLKTLSMQRMYIVPHQTLGFLKSMVTSSHHLRRLDLSNNALDWHMYEILGDLLADSKITHLALQSNMLSHNNMSALVLGIVSQNSSLLSIDLSDNFIGTLGFYYMMEAFGQSPRLSTLRLNRNNIRISTEQMTTSMMLLGSRLLSSGRRGGKRLYFRENYLYNCRPTVDYSSYFSNICPELLHVYT